MRNEKSAAFQISIFLMGILQWRRKDNTNLDNSQYYPEEWGDERSRDQ